jgi:aerobic C4-dicarboxylate transport protein
VLQVLLFAVLFGCALAMLGVRGAPVAAFVDTLGHVLFKVMGILIKLAPLGVLGAIAFTVAKYGLGSLKQLGMLVALFYLAVILFVVVVLGTIMRIAGFSIFKLLAYLREELTIVFATTSSDSVLPQIMAKLRRMGIRDSTVGLVIPTGYSFNLDAFSIYITLAGGVHRAGDEHADLDDRPADHPRDLARHLQGRARRAGLGDRRARGDAAGDPRDSRDRPRAGALGRLVHGHRPALGNLIGNCVATVAVAAWEGDIDRERAHAVLDGKLVIEDDEVAACAAGCRPWRAAA